MGKFSLLVVVALSAASLLAQSDRGTLTGLVTDPSGAAVPNVSIIATNLATGVKYASTTTETGNYLISQLPPGGYDVSAEARGFHTRIQKNVAINVAQT